MRRVPSMRTVKRPASLRILRCCETAGRLIGNVSASSPTACGFRTSSSKMSRRVGSPARPASQLGSSSLTVSIHLRKIWMSSGQEPMDRLVRKGALQRSLRRRRRRATYRRSGPTRRRGANGRTHRRPRAGFVARRSPPRARAPSARRGRALALRRFPNSANGARSARPTASRCAFAPAARAISAK